MVVESLRERKKVATRQTIVASARRLFLERGYDATTIEDITEAAVVSRRTFFRYFATKEDLVFADEDDMLATVGAGIDTAPAGLDPLATAAHAARLLADGLQAQRAKIVDQHRLVTATPSLQPRAQAKHLRWQSVLADHLIDRGVDADVAALTARVTIACFDIALARWYGDGTQPLRAHLTYAFALTRELVHDTGT